MPVSTLAGGAYVTTVSNVLKDLYLGPIAEQLNNDVLLLQRLEARPQDFVGNQAVVPVHTGRSGGIGARADREQLPAPGNQPFARAVYDVKPQYGVIQVSGLSMGKTKNDAGSFVKVLKAEMDGIVNDLKKDVARQSYGNSDGNTTGGNGRIAACGVTTASATVVLGSSEPLRKGHLYVGQVVDIGTAGSPNSLVDGVASATNGTITAINVATPSITVGTAITTTAANFVSRAGSAGKETNGLQDIVSYAASSLGGINAASAGSEYWDNNRATNAGTARALTLDLMVQARNTILVKGGQHTAIYTSFGVQRAYFNLLQSQVRYVEPMSLKSGFQTLEFMNNPVIADLDARFGQMYFLSEGDIKVYANSDWFWLNEDGNVLKYKTGFDAYEAVIARYLQFGAVRRNSHFLLADLTDTTGV